MEGKEKQTEHAVSRLRSRQQQALALQNLVYAHLFVERRQQRKI